MFGTFQIGLAILITTIAGVEVEPLPIHYVRKEIEQKPFLEIGVFDNDTPLPYSEPKIELKEKFLDKYIDREGEIGGECVEFIQREYDSYYTFPDFRGHASNIKPNSDEPKIGSAILTREWSGVGHASIVGDIIDGEIILIESNYHSDKKIQIGRKINVKDSRIRGYFHFVGDK